MAPLNSVGSSAARAASSPPIPCRGRHPFVGRQSARRRQCAEKHADADQPVVLHPHLTDSQRRGRRHAQQDADRVLRTPGPLDVPAVPQRQRVVLQRPQRDEQHADHHRHQHAPARRSTATKSPAWPVEARHDRARRTPGACPAARACATGTASSRPSCRSRSSHHTRGRRAHRVIAGASGYGAGAHHDCVPGRAAATAAPCSSAAAPRCRPGSARTGRTPPAPRRRRTSPGQGARLSRGDSSPRRYATPNMPGISQAARFR